MAELEKRDFKMADALKEELLETIEKAMESTNISQGEVARRIGALRHNINKVMRRKKVTTLDFLIKMAESIGLQVEMKIKRPKGH